VLHFFANVFSYIFFNLCIHFLFLIGDGFEFIHTHLVHVLDENQQIVCFHIGPESLFSEAYLVHNSAMRFGCQL